MSQAAAAPSSEPVSGRSTLSTRPRIERFQLSGPSRQLDPRIHAVRKDIADINLADRIFAPHYALAEIEAVSCPSVMLRSAPDDGAEACSQLLRGEEFAVLDISGGWAWGYCLHDHYVGYIRRELLGPVEIPTHRVTAREATLFSAADIKSPVIACLTLGARVTGTPVGDFLATADGFLHMRHVGALADQARDPVAVAEQLLGLPYLWGGRGAGGIDCSGLVQLAVGMASHACPRDTDLQRQGYGHEIPEKQPLKRGDLVYFPGHVGMMTDNSHIIHANAYWMAVTIEPLAAVVDRLRAQHQQPVLARRRHGA